MKQIFLSPPWVGASEREAVEGAFDSGYIAPCGPMVDEFDRRLGELSGMSAAAVASGTAALDLLMAELGVGAETTVIASTLTFIATVGPAWHRGAKPIFVDADPLTGTMSLPLLEQALKAATRGNGRDARCPSDGSRNGRDARCPSDGGRNGRDARCPSDGGRNGRDARCPSGILVLAADIYGQCCDYDGIEALCEKYGATLVVDAAEAVGATCRGRSAGQAGIASVYSFNGNKLITTSGGGAVLSRDPALVKRARWRAQQAREQAVWYEHREVGYNYRMSNLLAAVGCAQLDRMGEIIRRKRKIFDFYQALLGGDKRPGRQVVPFPCGDFTESTRWLSVFIFPTEEWRDAVAASLAANAIECRPVWKPMHLQPVFARCKVYGGEVAEDLFRRGLCLPSGAGMGKAALARIAQAIRAALG